MNLLVKSKMEISSNLVAFSKNTNFNIFWKKATFKTTLKIDTLASSLKYLWSVTAAKGAVIGTSHAKKKDFCELIRVSCNKVKEHCRKKQTKVREMVFCYQNCSSSDWEKILKFEAEGRKFAKIFRLPGQFVQTVKGQNNVW